MIIFAERTDTYASHQIHAETLQDDPVKRSAQPYVQIQNEIFREPVF